MRITPINFYNAKTNNIQRNFKGITKELPKKFVESGSFGGGQGDYQQYEVTVEYHPFANESALEIEKNMKKLEYSTMYTPPAYTYPGSYTVYPDSEIIDYKPVLKSRLHCTVEEADLVIKEYLKNQKQES